MCGYPGIQQQPLHGQVSCGKIFDLSIWVRLFCDDLTGGKAACEGAGIHSVRRMLRTAIEWRDARVTEALAAT